MAVKSSGSLSLITDIVGEFSGTAPHGLKEYYSGGTYVPSLNTGIASSGAINMLSFYGTTNVIDASSVITPVTINGETTAQEITISDYISSGDVFQIPSSWWIWSEDRKSTRLNSSH